MQVTNISELRKNLKSYVSSVADNNDTLVVHGNGKTVVMVSLDAYNKLDETSYLLASKANAERLREGIRDFENGKKNFIEKELIEE